MANIHLYIESTNNHEHELAVEFDYTIGNDGIGSYEYWGARCYDAGTDYIEEVIIIGIEVLKSFPKKDKNGNIVKNKNGSILMKDIFREIDIEKLSCVDLETLEDKIKEEFDFENDCEEPDYSDDDYCHSDCDY